jgi:hypothetical protein
MLNAFFHRAYYRSSQFFKAIGARVTDEDLALVELVLATSAQRALFARMPAADQCHAVGIVRTLRAEGQRHPALMHDMAKSGAGISVFHRVAVVLLQWFRPGWLEWLAGDAERSSLKPWRRPFARYLEHPAIGACWAEEADCLPLAVSLIRRHQLLVSPSSDIVEDQLLRLLKAADDKN